MVEIPWLSVQWARSPGSILVGEFRFHKPHGTVKKKKKKKKRKGEPETNWSSQIPQAGFDIWQAMRPSALKLD